MWFSINKYSELELLITLNKIHQEKINPKKMKAPIKMKTGRDIVGSVGSTVLSTGIGVGGGGKKYI